MKHLEENQQEISTDILIIGGGIAGLAAAVTAKETDPGVRVLIVEKQTAGYSGKANKGGGVLQYFDLERVHPMEFVAYHANAVGGFLGDQELLLKYVSMNHEIIGKLVSWGVNIPRNEDGSLKVIPTGPMVGMIGVDLDITLQVRKTAEKKGVQIIDKVTISDLLTDQGRIAGAVGYSIIDGTFYVVKAKSVILATGSQDYKVMHMWNSATGDGIAAAYRAGAEIRNPDFGNFCQLYKVESHQDMVFSENVMYNSLGENITKNFRWFPEADISSSALAEWYNEMSAGRGPIYIKPEEYEVTRNEEELFITDHIWARSYGLKWWRAGFGKASKVNTKPLEVAPGFVGEQSPVKVNHDMETTIAGLFAIGDVSYSGSALPGAVPAPPGRNRGSGILNAVFAAMLGGEKSVRFAEGTAQSELSPDQVKALMENAYAPLYQAEGVEAREIVDELKEIICPVENTVYISEHRLLIALRKLEKIKTKAVSMKAADFHDLLSCHEAEAMILCAEMFFRAALMRKESRGWFLREDYPQTDNQNWLNWIVVKKTDGKMELSKEQVPIDQYPIKPNH